MDAHPYKVELPLLQVEVPYNDAKINWSMKTPLSRISIGVTCAEVWDHAQLSSVQFSNHS